MQSPLRHSAKRGGIIQSTVVYPFTPTAQAVSSPPRWAHMSEVPLGHRLSRELMRRGNRISTTV